MKVHLIALCLSVRTATALRGDSMPEYASCVSDCKAQLCRHLAPDPARQFSSFYQDNMVLRHLWSCDADCQYQCVQIVTDTLILSQKPLVQFYGKWPFYRVAGCQEFFSMLFLVANLYTNGRNWKFMLSRYKSSGGSAEGHDVMYLQYLVLIVVLVIGWTLSTIFHTRDTAVTETLDYFGAFAIVCLNFNIIVTRYFHLFEPQRRRQRYMWQAALFLGYCFHLAYLVHDWDYRRNTMVSVVIGLVALSFWVLHSLRVRRYCAEHEARITSSVSCVTYETRVLHSVRSVPVLGRFIAAYPAQMRVLPIYLNMILLMGLSLELLDFTPFFRLVDAHSLWHLVTLFAPLVWYDWNAWDVEILRDVSKV